MRLSEEKTKIVHIDEGFDFLAGNPASRKRGTEKLFVYTYPSAKALASVKAQGADSDPRGTNQPLETLLAGSTRSAGMDQLLPVWLVGEDPQLPACLHVAQGDLLASSQAPSRNWKQLRQRYLQGWWPAQDKADCSTRRRWRSPATGSGERRSPRPGPGASGVEYVDRRHRLVESRMRATRTPFGVRTEETERAEARHRARSDPHWGYDFETSSRSWTCTSAIFEPSWRLARVPNSAHGPRRWVCDPLMTLRWRMAVILACVASALGPSRGCFLLDDCLATPVGHRRHATQPGGGGERVHRRPFATSHGHAGGHGPDGGSESACPVPGEFAPATAAQLVSTVAR